MPIGTPEGNAVAFEDPRQFVVQESPFAPAFEPPLSLAASKASYSSHAIPMKLLRNHPIACLLALVILVISVCIWWFFLVRSDLADFAQLGSSFQTIGAVFTALAFAGVIFTIYLQGLQIQAQLNEYHLNSLQKRVGELIGDAGKILTQIGPGTLPALKISIREIRRTKEQEKADKREDPFLEDLSRCLEEKIPTDDKFRRRYVFKALHSLISKAPPGQRRFLKESLLAQIHETAARVLILQAIAAKDRELLEIFGQLGIGFSSFERDIPDLHKELEERFPNRNV